MRATVVASLWALLAVGCGKEQDWSQELQGYPLHADDVVVAVASLPECRHVLDRGLKVVWRPLVTCGSGAAVSGCSYPSASPPRIEIVYRASAWDGPSHKPQVSTLAHELCHVCGYSEARTENVELQADACALRAKALSNDGG